MYAGYKDNVAYNHSTVDTSSSSRILSSIALVGFIAHFTLHHQSSYVTMKTVVVIRYLINCLHAELATQMHVSQCTRPLLRVGSGHVELSLPWKEAK